MHNIFFCILYKCIAFFLFLFIVLSERRNIYIYIDDVKLGGAPLIIASDVELIKDKAKQYGLTLNISKCELIAEDPNKFSDI